MFLTFCFLEDEGKYAGAWGWHPEFHEPLEGSLNPKASRCEEVADGVQGVCICVRSVKELRQLGLSEM